MLLTSCVTNGRGIDKTPDPVVIDTACKWVGFIYISKQDVLTDGTARQILAHNEALAKNCGKPSK
ncbi:Rz1 [Xanthomonas phage Langgrundblatt2]|uniref:Rz1 n=2 Tax=Shirevirus TaxID=3153128 RepID=A0A9E7E0Y9_9CAUD|nr:Rz1 [Xanthomonas phage Langgrundblatt1]YP_010742908.1 Rz1 [Xanthomonas phage Langgrundblatt2]URA06790.1 Rz1 [Xanthomonas phage Langgrundblatt1]URA06859.1 Rz1 [Xanthomonas phage Langgrundblatt2]